MKVVSETAAGEGTTLTLRYNPEAKNLLIAAKVSEFKKRIEIIKACVNGWTSKSQSINALLETSCN